MNWDFDRPELKKDAEGFYPGEREGIPHFLRREPTPATNLPALPPSAAPLPDATN